MKDGPHAGDLARSGDRRERSDLGGRRLPILSAGNGVHESVAGGTEAAKRSGLTERRPVLRRDRRCCAKQARRLVLRGTAYRDAAGRSLGRLLGGRRDQVIAIPEKSGRHGRTNLGGQAMSNPVVLITGALTGIGRATAIAFAKEGARVVASGRREAEGKALEAELRSLGTE